MTWIIAARFLRERAEAGYMILLVPGELSPNRGERASGKRALAWHVRSTDNVDTCVDTRDHMGARGRMDGAAEGYR